MISSFLFICPICSQFWNKQIVSVVLAFRSLLFLLHSPIWYRIFIPPFSNFPATFTLPHPDLHPSPVLSPYFTSTLGSWPTYSARPAPTLPGDFSDWIHSRVINQSHDAPKPPGRARHALTLQHHNVLTDIKRTAAPATSPWLPAQNTPSIGGEDIYLYASEF